MLIPHSQPSVNPLHGLSASARAVLDETLYLMALRVRRKQSLYLTAGRAYFARKTGYSLVTISHAYRQLEARGLLNVTARRQIRGCWQTNLLRVCKAAYPLLADRVTLLVHRVKTSIHIAPMNENRIKMKGKKAVKKATHAKVQAEIKEIFARLRSKCQT